MTSYLVNNPGPGKTKIFRLWRCSLLRAITQPAQLMSQGAGLGFCRADAVEIGGPDRRGALGEGQRPDTPAAVMGGNDSNFAKLRVMAGDAIWCIQQDKR